MFWLNSFTTLLPLLNTDIFVNKLLSLPQVKCRDTSLLSSKLDTIRQDEQTELLILSDFDYTFSKAYDLHGNPLLSTIGVIDNFLPKDLSTELSNLWANCLIIETNPSMSYEEKASFMEKCWTDAHRIILSAGITKSQIKEWSLMSKIELRDGVNEIANHLLKEEIPLILFSAGVTDIVEIILGRELGQSTNHIQVISNALKYDKTERAIGFAEPLIHCFNKNVSTIEQETFSRTKTILSRKNVLLMGDSLGDLYMGKEREKSQGVTLKIGFLNSHNNDTLIEYLNGYDIVLIDDQTMQVPGLILEFLSLQ
ncbi:unnamed protein product, partial [Mesorhabditis belari]|uniref:5'-nucleotidase n=1 Tax=Mesorhabditis belari TaxID=2138241 RepID=A0AAF3ENY7_9BILA